jgi:AAA domain/Bifunctional DNA primase/polymerase, N-terminal/Primase C terminal 1 (PriCT-1)
MTPITPAEHLELYRALGWRLVRAGHDKRPLGRWKAAQTAPMTDADWQAIRDHVERGGEVGVVCGAISGGLAVVDLDTDAAKVTVRDALGLRWDTLPRASTPRGCHLYTVGDARTLGRSKSAGWDLRAEGGFAVLPLGRDERRWEVAPTSVGGLPVFVSVAPHLPTAEETSSGPPSALESSSAGAGRSGGLADLLAAPPRGEGSGRNNWLAQVAGGYARHIPYRDAYEASVRAAAALLDPPLPEVEVAKLIPSIWNAEQAKAERADAEREERVRREVERLLVGQEARERIAAAEWEPPEVATDAAALFAQPEPEQRWSVDQLASHGDNVLLAAQYKAGKTTLLLSLLRALADGEPFLGRFDAGTGVPVAWLNYELTDATARRWLTDIGFQHPERVVLVGLRGHRNPLASRDGQAWLVRLLAERGVQYVAVDTFRAAYTGTDHNASTPSRLAPPSCAPRQEAADEQPEDLRDGRLRPRLLRARAVPLPLRIAETPRAHPARPRVQGAARRPRRELGARLGHRAARRRLPHRRVRPTA